MGPIKANAFIPFEKNYVSPFYPFILEFDADDTKYTAHVSSIAKTL